MSAFHEFHPLAQPEHGLSKVAFRMGQGIAVMHAGKRAYDLSDDDRKALREHYGLATDADLYARNVWRGSLGGLAGAIAGYSGGTLLGNGLSFGGRKKRLAQEGLALLGGLVGGGLASRKYSKANARSIRDNKGE